MPDNGDRLEPRINQGGISTVAPPRLASQLQSLPPMLHRFSPNSMASCSKASRGLFVPLRVTCIFTRPSMFAESLVETVLLSLRHSCGSDGRRRGFPAGGRSGLHRAGCWLTARRRAPRGARRRKVAQRTDRRRRRGVPGARREPFARAFGPAGKGETAR